MLANQKIEAEEAVAENEAAAGDDEAWAKANLRFQDGKPISDMANVLRVLQRHSDFEGRFVYNETLNKVLDKGEVMLDWRVSECCAVIQERFVPGVAEADVNAALVIHANRCGVRK